MRNYFILNTEKGLFASSLNQPGFSKGNGSHSTYFEYNTDAVSPTLSSAPNTCLLCPLTPFFFYLLNLAGASY